MSNQHKDTTQAVMDGLLKFLAAGGFLTVGLTAPNALQAFGKPMFKLLDKLDERAAKREVKRVMYYMKQQGLIRYTARDYENGIILTRAGREKLKRRDYETLSISYPKDWDGRWRLVFFDIPEDLKAKRNTFTRKLKLLGFQQLQQSIWVHPFPARAEVEVISQVIGLRRFVSYVEIIEIDNSKELRQRFKTLLG